MGKIKFWIALVILLIVILLGAETLGFFTKSNQKSIVISSGEAFSHIVVKLHDQGVIRSKLLFKIYAKLTAGEKLTEIKYGEVVFHGRASYKGVIKELIDADRTSNELSLTIPEGYELREIATLLEEKGLVTRKAFYDVATNYDFDYEFLKNIEKRENRLEGFLFPDTYLISKTEDTEITIIQKMLNRFDEIYQKYKQYETKLDMSTYEIITLASIIEREAMYEEDFVNVSSVFHNRLKRTDYLKYLQSCATVQYILKERKTVLSEADTKIDSPYNTYKYPYLPAGPISSPGERAISAAVNPAKTNYYYFLNDSNGKLHFSATFEEHKKMMNQYVN